MQGFDSFSDLERNGMTPALHTTTYALSCTVHRIEDLDISNCVWRVGRSLVSNHLQANSDSAQKLQCPEIDWMPVLSMACDCINPSILLQCSMRSTHWFQMYIYIYVV